MPLDAEVDQAVLRRYELDSEIGKGSYGIVFSVSFARRDWL